MEVVGITVRSPGDIVVAEVLKASGHTVAAAGTDAALLRALYRRTRIDALATVTALRTVIGAEGVLWLTGTVREIHEDVRNMVQAGIFDPRCLVDSATSLKYFEDLEDHTARIQSRYGAPCVAVRYGHPGRVTVGGNMMAAQAIMPLLTALYREGLK